MINFKLEQCKKILTVAADYHEKGNTEKTIELYKRYLDLNCGTQAEKEEITQKIKDLETH